MPLAAADDDHGHMEDEEDDFAPGSACIVGTLMTMCSEDEIRRRDEQMVSNALRDTVSPGVADYMRGPSSGCPPARSCSRRIGLESLDEARGSQQDDQEVSAVGGGNSSCRAF